MAWDKTKTVDLSVSTQPVKTDVYLKVGGSYVFQSTFTGSSRSPLRKVLVRNWNNFDSPPSHSTFRAIHGYLPTQSMYESTEYWSQYDLPVCTYFYDNGTYRTDNKTIDPVHIPLPSGFIGFDLYGWSSTVEKNALILDAQHNCLAKARDMKVHVPVMFAEGRETVRMLADTVRTLGKAYRNFRRGRFRQAMKDLELPFVLDRVAAQHWLAYQLGWRPLISDAVGLLRLAEKGLLDTSRGPRFTASGTAVSTKTPTWTLPQGASFWPGGLTRYRATGVVKAKAALLLEYKAGANGLASVGMGNFDLLSTAWEATPFSFVFDYFVNIGRYLESLSSLQDVTVLTGYSSTIEWNFGSATMEKPSTNGWIEGVKPKASWSHRVYSRTPWTGSVTLQSPLLDGLNAKRITTIAALFSQMTKGDRNPGGYRP